ncbi:MAG TPA: hypothetical protein VIL38_07370 [Thermaerobacter sp.]
MGGDTFTAAENVLTGGEEPGEPGEPGEQRQEQAKERRNPGGRLGEQDGQGSSP